MGVSKWYAVSSLLLLTTSYQTFQLIKEPTKNIVKTNLERSSLVPRFASLCKELLDYCILGDVSVEFSSGNAICWMPASFLR